MDFKDTYELLNAKKLESIEWDDLWFQEANDESKRRVLFIGDSITSGIRPFINELLNQKGFVADKLTTSKAVDNPHLTKLIDYAVAQRPKCEIIHVLFGGHGYHLSKDEYEIHYRRIIRYLIDNYNDKKLMISSFTPIRDSGDLTKLFPNIEKVIEKAEAGKKISSEFNIPFVNLYGFMLEKDNASRLYQPDGVHFKDEGYKLLAQKIFECMEKML